MVKITFLDGSDIVIEKDTVINGYRNDSDDQRKEYYLRQVFSNSIDGSEGKEASQLATVDEKVGVMGFILSVDCFSIGRNTESNTLYRSSAVKSVENTSFAFG